ncbi:ShlB/FhaC/HecB family hemolysin secretion/activation protein [Paraburkholderia sp.]|uniref:ShlB/FhaC/HecB family hemolysin secretion/activation protein n=1 Tax=Paraburkholderia sp. TaxID=1926495 RepID=UPI002B4A6297|nr:ShlB/FhaC/HecB family hemolysin secretion/activation protein [Paraburkholderia sp.]
MYAGNGKLSPAFVSGVIAGIALSVRVAAAVPEPSPADTMAEASAQFDVWEYRVLGNSRLPSERVEETVYPFLGAAKTIQDVDRARQALEAAYHDAGYGTVFVDVPEQNTEGGIVRLQVSEGRIDRVRISGARYFANGDIRAAVPELQSGKVPHLPHLQTELNALNAQTGDRAVVPVLKAGRVPGTVDVELKVQDTLPLHASVEVNDRYTADTSKLRANAIVSYGNLFQRQHSLTLQYQTAPEDRADVESIVGTYAFRVPAWGDTTVALYAVDSDTDVATLGTLSVLGKGKIFGLRAVHVLMPVETYSHNVTFGLDYKDFLENIRLPEDEGLVTPIKYLNWSISYGGSKRSQNSLTGVNVSANFGVRGVQNESTEFEEKRFKGAPNYFYLRAGLEQAFRMPFDFQLYGRAAGQFTQSPLVSNEQFAIGGVDTVRGYLESAQLGDYGAVGTVELRQSSLSSLLKLPFGAAYVAAFYDAGIVQIMRPLPSQQSTFDLASAGVGLRIDGWHGFSLAFDWAYPLQDNDRTERGDDRTHFLFKYGF